MKPIMPLKPCFGCPWTKDSLVSPERVRDIVKGLRKKNTHFTCHKAQTEPKLKGDTIVCRGYFDHEFLLRGTGNLMRIYMRLGGVTEVDFTRYDKRARKTFTTHREIEAATRKPRRRS